MIRNLQKDTKLVSTKSNELGSAAGRTLTVLKLFWKNATTKTATQDQIYKKTIYKFNPASLQPSQKFLELH